MEPSEIRIQQVHEDVHSMGQEPGRKQDFLE